MAYFDSPKNKALWDKEIARLESERERRRQNGFKPVVSDGEERSEDSSLFGRISEKVRLITLEELERIVREKKGLSSKGHAREMSDGARVRDPRVNEREMYELRPDNHNVVRRNGAG